CVIALSENPTMMIGMNQSSRAALVARPVAGAGTANKPFANAWAISGATVPERGGMVAWAGAANVQAATSQGSARRAARVVTAVSLPQIPEDGWPDPHH